MNDSSQHESNGRGEHENPPPVQDLLQVVGATTLGDRPSPAAREAVLVAVVERLRGANRLYRALVRTELIHAVGLRAIEVDAALDSLSDGPQNEAAAASALVTADPEPSPDPVDGAELLSDLSRELETYVVLPPGAAIAVPLWILMTYVVDAFYVLPRLAVTSAVLRSGKTTLLQMLSVLCHRPVTAANLTPAVTFRLIDYLVPSLLIDEADLFARRSPELMGVLNSGHTRTSAIVWRCVGDDSEPRPFSTFCPIAIALIGRLWPTQADRSIEVRMKRRTRQEKVKRFRFDRLQEFQPYQQMAARWAQDNLAALTGADPDVPEELNNDRAQDNWRTLLSIADLAGGVWPEKAREAALLLSAKLDDDVTDVGVRLLQDLKLIFDEEAKPQLATSEIIYALTAGDREWKEHRDGKPITPIQLARELRAFEIRPRMLHFPYVVDKKGRRGYRREWFEDAWTRYLPAQPADADLQDPQEANNDAAS